MNDLDKPDSPSNTDAAETSQPSATAEKIPESVSGTAPAKASEQSAAATESGKSRLPLILTGINLLLLLGAAGWVYTHMQYTNQQLLALNGQQSGLDGQLREQTRRLELVADKAQGSSGHADQLQTELQKILKQLAHNTDAIARLPGAERQDWLVAEVEYLLRLAGQRLQLERDVQGAISMLTAADQVLLEIDNPSLNPVREQIAVDVLALRKVPSVDRSGAVLRLQALQDAIDDLPWQLRPHFEWVPAVQQAPNAAAEAWYWQLWHSVQDGIGQVVRIRRHDLPLDTPMSQDQAYYLQQGMRLMLEQAQVALLRRDQQLYDHSLLRVSEWLDHYLASENDSTTAVRTGLQEVSGWQVAPKVPDISASLLTLRHLLEQQRRGLSGEDVQ